MLRPPQGEKNDGPIFIRHNQEAVIFMKPGRATELFNQNLIAIDFGPNRHKYPKGEEGRALTKLRACRKKGAIVCAEYSEKDEPTKIVVSKIRRNTRMRYKIILNKRIPKTFELDKNLRQVIPIGSHGYMLLKAIRPRQGTVRTFRRLSSIQCVEAIFNKKSLPLKVGSLTPEQLEVICYEYLRDKKGLSRLIMPIGRTLQDVDIWGISKDGKDIFAQVTHSEDANKIGDKLVDLKSHKSHMGKKSVLFFFGPENEKHKCSGTECTDINYIPVEVVFKEFKKSDMITAMLPRNYLKT